MTNPMHHGRRNPMYDRIVGRGIDYGMDSMSLPVSSPAMPRENPRRAPDPRPRFLSEADCHEIANRLARLAQGGGSSAIVIASVWRGNVRWARNRISSSGEDRNDHVVVSRNLRGAQSPYVGINNTTDEALLGAARRAERLARFAPEHPEDDYDNLHWQPEPEGVAPNLFFDTTYQQDAARRADTAERLAQSAAAVGMLSAGYLEVSAHSIAYINSLGYARYFQYTWAQYSVTVRDPKGTGSGWAGVDWPDWNRIDGDKLSAIALEKCLKSLNPVAIEPGRYTTILEPQAVADFVGKLVADHDLERDGPKTYNERFQEEPFNKEREWPGDDKRPGFSLLGERVVDHRLSFRADPLDPDLGFPPFRIMQNYLDTYTPIADVYHPATWIKDGVLVNLAYPRQYAIDQLGQQTGLPNSGAFRIDVTGPTASIDDMVAATKRGLLVTRFDQVEHFDSPAKPVLCRGMTRDGLWLIENGKISKPVKNLMFVESVLFALNNIEQLGVPQRVFHPPSEESWTFWQNPEPAIVPAMKVRDFSFTALVDAV